MKSKSLIRFFILTGSIMIYHDYQYNKILLSALDIFKKLKLPEEFS